MVFFRRSQPATCAAIAALLGQVPAKVNPLTVARKRDCRGSYPAIYSGFPVMRYFSRSLALEVVMGFRESEVKKRINNKRRPVA
jgi:hypothetical protein